MQKGLNIALGFREFICCRATSPNTLLWERSLNNVPIRSMDKIGLFCTECTSRKADDYASKLFPDGSKKWQPLATILTKSSYVLYA